MAGFFVCKHFQLVVMYLQTGEDIGNKDHQNVDQFFRIEEGRARFMFNERKVHQLKQASLQKRRREPLMMRSMQ